MLVRLEKDWSYPDVRRQTVHHDGRWGDVVVTDDPVPECDLLLVLNSPKEDIRVRVPAGNKWLFTQESPIDHYEWHTRSFPHFDRIFSFWDASRSDRIIHEQTALPWHVGRSYSELVALDRERAVAEKRDAVSWVTSNATWKVGHRTRMMLKDHLQAHDFPFDLYGRGFTPIENKFDAIFPYKYSFAIENYACDNYWTEKIADCFLSWTVPIYSGATNITSYFPADSMILIDPTDLDQSLEIVRSAIAGDHFGKHLDAIAEARRLVLDRYQFFPDLSNKIERFATPAGSRREKAFIPANPKHYENYSSFDMLKRNVKSLLGHLAWQLR